MKAIVCELCGSNEFVKEDKYFVCQYCGTKYSVEDAKTLLVEGTVKIDESNKLSNMLKNAEDLYYDGKTEEAYKLFGEVLNIDTKCSRAILYRGLCSSWETTINKPKLFDCIKGLEKALKIEDESFEKRTKLSEDGLREIDKLYSAIELLYRNNFNDYINAANKLTEKAQSSIYRYGLDVNANFYMEQLNSASGKLKEKSELYNKINADLTYNYASAIYLSILNYKEKEKLKLSFLRWTLINFSNFEKNIYGDKMPSAALDTIRKLEKLIEKIQEEKNNEYWEKHKDEKEKIKKEIEDAEKRIEKINQELEEEKSKYSDLNQKANAKVPSETNRQLKKKEIEELQNMKNELGIFKGKEKKTIQSMIDMKVKELEKIEENIYKERLDLNREYNVKLDESEVKISKLKKKIEEEEERIRKEEEKLKKDHG